MKCMNRNKAKFCYALYESKETIYDEWGNTLGEQGSIYGDPVFCFASISAAQGEAQARQFGADVSYDKVIVMDESAPPIDEYTVLWVDRMPELDGNGALATDENGIVLTPHDYVVKKVARSLNSVSYAISKVNVS